MKIFYFSILCLLFAFPTFAQEKAPQVFTKGHNCDEYASLPLADEFARLDPTAIQLSLDDESVAVIHLRTRRSLSRRQANAYVATRLNHLTRRLKIARNRLIFVIEKTDAEYTSSCIWKRGMEQVDCVNCLVIRKK